MEPKKVKNNRNKAMDNVSKETERIGEIFNKEPYMFKNTGKKICKISWKFCEVNNLPGIEFCNKCKIKTDKDKTDGKE